jgi:hypothetical protein
MINYSIVTKERTYKDVLLVGLKNTNQNDIILFNLKNTAQKKILNDCNLNATRIGN